MPYYEHTFSEMHWSCKECLVRPMCNERCSKTYLKHYKCDGCDGRSCFTKGFPCETVKKYMMFEQIQKSYGPKIVELCKKNIDQTSIFGLLRIANNQLEKRKLEEK
jgi:hypothetical protein